jgi:hypothetical protein
VWVLIEEIIRSFFDFWKLITKSCTHPFVERCQFFENCNAAEILDCLRTRNGIFSPFVFIPNIFMKE